jgi:hypothetical protein
MKAFSLWTKPIWQFVGLRGPFLQRGLQRVLENMKFLQIDVDLSHRFFLIFAPSSNGEAKDRPRAMDKLFGKSILQGQQVRVSLPKLDGIRSWHMDVPPSDVEIVGGCFRLMFERSVVIRCGEDRWDSRIKWI